MKVNITFLVSTKRSEVPNVSGMDRVPTITLTSLSQTPEAVPPNLTCDLSIESGKVLFVTGPNGVGKSSLLATIGKLARVKGASIETFFGSRQLQFQSDDVDQVGQSPERLQNNIEMAVTRFQHPWGEQHLKSVVRRLIDLQAQATHDIVEAQEDGSAFDTAKAAHPLLITSINGIFKTARLPIQIELIAGRLRARREDAVYGIDRLSDGERAALVLVGAVLIQPKGTFIIIDEPERHLNPGISGSLIAALVRARSDLGFIFASHDLKLLDWLHPERIIHLRDSHVMTPNPEERSYEITLISQQDGMSEDFQSAILGARRMLLLVEGETTSKDQALYAQIYPLWNVVARGGWETVVNGVKALRCNQNYHWLHAVGIIDRDGRDEAQQESLSAEQIFCLPVPTIENLFFHPVVLEQMASEIFKLKGGLPGAKRIEQLKAQLPQLLNDCRQDVIDKGLVWEANRLHSNYKVSVKSLRQGQTEIPRIDLDHIKRRLEAEFDNAASLAAPIRILFEFPIKNSAMPNRVAKQLGFDGFNDYAQSTLRQIEVNSSAGQSIIRALRTVMPELPTIHAT